jgi:single-strand DNA-binding protein
MINRAILLGRLTKDPEMRYTPNGTAVTTFTLAIDRRMTNQQGQRETDFLPIVVWSKLAELCAQYLKKGQQAAVEGRIQVRNYENKEGGKYENAISIRN